MSLKHALLFIHLRFLGHNNSGGYIADNSRTCAEKCNKYPAEAHKRRVDIEIFCDTAANTIEFFIIFDAPLASTENMKHHERKITRYENQNYRAF